MFDIRYNVHIHGNAVMLSPPIIPKEKDGPVNSGIIHNLVMREQWRRKSSGKNGINKALQKIHVLFSCPFVITCELYAYNS
jgi:hypothetical protein